MHSLVGLRVLGPNPVQSFWRGLWGTEATGVTRGSAAIVRPKASTKPSKITRVSGFLASLGRARFGSEPRRVLVSFENCMLFLKIGKIQSFEIQESIWIVALFWTVQFWHRVSPLSCGFLNSHVFQKKRKITFVQKSYSSPAVGRLRDSRFGRQNNSAVLWNLNFAFFRKNKKNVFFAKLI